jgi:hypothetical protein
LLLGRMASDRDRDISGLVCVWPSHVCWSDIAFDLSHCGGRTVAEFVS